MKLVSLSIAYFFIFSASAFAGSDHYHAEQTNRPPAALDSTQTSSVMESLGIGAMNATPIVRKPVADDNGSRDHWGR